MAEHEELVPSGLHQNGLADVGGLDGQPVDEKKRGQFFAHFSREKKNFHEGVIQNFDSRVDVLKIRLNAFSRKLPFFCP
jgi:hypothetical protein